MTRFRPCIDLHHGKVKLIVGGSLRGEGAGPMENFGDGVRSIPVAEASCRKRFIHKPAP